MNHSFQTYHLVRHQLPLRLAPGCSASSEFGRCDIIIMLVQDVCGGPSSLITAEPSIYGDSKKSVLLHEIPFVSEDWNTTTSSTHRHSHNTQPKTVQHSLTLTEKRNEADISFIHIVVSRMFSHTKLPSVIMMSQTGGNCHHIIHNSTWFVHQSIHGSGQVCWRVTHHLHHPKFMSC